MGQTASGSLAKCCQTPMAGSTSVLQGADGLQLIQSSKPRGSAKAKRKKVSQAVDTSVFDPQSNDLRLTPSKRKLILIREGGDDNLPTVKKAAIDAEEAQEMLHKAAARGDVKAVQKAIASGASVTTQNVRGLSPLMQCAGSLGATAVEALQVLVEHGACVATVDQNGWNALHHACRSGKVASAKYLLSVGADPKSTTADTHKKTALMLATEDSKYDIVAHLLKDRRLKDHLNEQDAHGYTALHYAMKVGSKDIGRALLDQGAKARVRDSEGRQPIMVACEHGKLDCVKLFINKDQKGKVDINATDDQKRTALMLACLNRYEDIALWLIRKCKMDLFATDINGESAVSIARGFGLRKAIAAMTKPKEDADDGEDAARRG
jgi:ankyrin repeat protein